MVLLMIVIVFKVFNYIYDSSDSRDCHGRPPFHNHRDEYNEGEKDYNTKSMTDNNFFHYNKELENADARRNRIYPNKALHSQDHRSSQNDILRDRSYSSSISDSSCQSNIIQEVEGLKRKLIAMQEELSAFTQTKRIEAAILLRIKIDFEAFNHFMMNEFSFFISKAIESTSPWLSQYRSTILSSIFNHNIMILLNFRADAISVIGQSTRDNFPELSRMMKVIQEVNIPKSYHRRDFLGFLQKCWKYLPEYISKDDPFECNFPPADTTQLPKYWTGGRNAAGLLKYVAFYIADYLNANDKLPDAIEDQPKVCNLRLSFKSDLISSMLSEQFGNKRWYVTHKVKKRKSSLKTVKMEIKPEIIANQSSLGNKGK
jgi:hypothetical protein